MSPSFSPPPSSGDELYSTEEADKFVADLLSRPEREALGSEIEVLKSIYGDEAIRIWRPTPQHGDKIRYEVEVGFPSPYEDVKIKILASLPPSYPSGSAPQLQLLSRYIGAFGVDSNLFGAILRSFISSSGVEWTPDVVCVFDGIQNVLEHCIKWYEERLSAEKAGELLREDEKEVAHSNHHPLPSENDYQNFEPPAHLPEGIEIFEAEPIVDRKSSFVGRACAISDPSQVLNVPLILSHFSADRRIARAAHPIINAWRCQVGNVLHQDNDDDGETAAGGRLAHLLQILVNPQHH
ncbi:imprinted and ancient [Moniliophthora roreri]|nr:imprinted and ancient [Moniliophthora roreri]